MDRAALDAATAAAPATRVERCLERQSEAAAKLGAQADELAPGPPSHAMPARLRNAMLAALSQVDSGPRLAPIAD